MLIPPCEERHPKQEISRTIDMFANQFGDCTMTPGRWNCNFALFRCQSRFCRSLHHHRPLFPLIALMLTFTAGCRSSELSHRHPHNDRPTDWLTDWLIAHLQEATPFSRISASLVAVGLLAPTAAAAAALMRITLLCKGRKCIAVTHRKAFLSFVSGDEGAMKVEDAENQYTTIYTSI